MEIYEIVKYTHNPKFGTEYFKTEIITATVDKELAEQMLTIYRSNQGMDEAYQIRTLREPKVASLNSESDWYNRCTSCNSYNRCVMTILEHPEEMIRCMHFGKLKERIKRKVLGYED